MIRRLSPPHQQQVGDVVAGQEARPARPRRPPPAARAARCPEPLERLLKAERGRHGRGHPASSPRPRSSAGAALAQAADQVVAGEDALGPAQVVDHGELPLLARQQQLHRLGQRGVDRDGAEVASPSSRPPAARGPPAGSPPPPPPLPAPRKTKNATSTRSGLPCLDEHRQPAGHREQLTERARRCGWPGPGPSGWPAGRAAPGRRPCGKAGIRLNRGAGRWSQTAARRTDVARTQVVDVRGAAAQPEDHDRARRRSPA